MSRYCKLLQTWTLQLVCRRLNIFACVFLVLVLTYLVPNLIINVLKLDGFNMM